MSVYSGAAGRISGIIHPDYEKKKRIPYFRWKPAIYMGNALR